LLNLLVALLRNRGERSGPSSPALVGGL